MKKSSKGETIERITKLKMFMLNHADGVHIDDIVEHMEPVTRIMVYRDLKSIGATTDNDGNWSYEASQQEKDFANAILGIKTPFRKIVEISRK